MNGLKEIVEGRVDALEDKFLLINETIDGKFSDIDENMKTQFDRFNEQIETQNDKVLSSNQIEEMVRLLNALVSQKS